MKKLLIKKKCKCGRSVIVKRNEHGPTPKPICRLCVLIGLERSKLSFKSTESEGGIKKDG